MTAEVQHRVDAWVPMERRALLSRYADLLASEGIARGLLGPRERPRIWDRHVANSLDLVSVLPSTAETVADLGTGAGLPGLVVGIARPELDVTLVEPLLRRTEFLNEVVCELGLGNVTVVRGRAESLHGQRRFDVVTSRALAPLGRLLDWSMPLVGGELLAMKGRSLPEELAACAGELERRGVHATIESGPSAEGETLFIRVTWGAGGPVAWPRLGEPARGRGSGGRRAPRADRRRPGSRGDGSSRDG